MSTVYSVQFFADSYAAMPTGAPVVMVTAGTVYRSVIREVVLSAIFGSFGDDLALGYIPAASGLPMTIADLGGDSPPPALVVPLRLVMQPGDQLYFLQTASSLPAKGGVVVSGYNLSLP